MCLLKENLVITQLFNHIHINEYLHIFKYQVNIFIPIFCPNIQNCSIAYYILLLLLLMLPYIFSSASKQFHIHHQIFISLYFCFSFWEIFLDVTGSSIQTILLFSPFMNNFIFHNHCFKMLFYFYKHSFKFQETYWFSGFSFFRAVCFCFIDAIFSGILLRMIVLNFSFMRILFPSLLVSFFVLIDFLQILDDLQWFVNAYGQKREGREKERLENGMLISPLTRLIIPPKIYVVVFHVCGKGKVVTHTYGCILKKRLI